MKTIEKKSSSLISKLEEVGREVGNTPLYSLDKIFKKPGVKIFAKQEWKQIGGSVKARPAYFIIKEAIEKGKINARRGLLDATSGNTGIAYAAIGAALGIKVTLCLPSNASLERKVILCNLGAEIILTSPLEGTDGAQIRAKELAKKYPQRYYYTDQYGNENNWRSHYHGTALEIFSQTQGKVSHFVAGLGTSGTFRGTTTRLRELKPKVKAIALHPDSPMHGLEGWKHMETAIVPRIYKAGLADLNMEIDSYEAMDMLKTVVEKTGLRLSPSAAANILGAIKVAEKIDRGVIVTVLPDDGSKYSEVYELLFNS